MSQTGHTILGFDFGERRIGIAVGNTLTGTAGPVTSVSWVRSNPDWGAITDLLAQWRPQVLVVGLPIHMDGSAHPLAELVDRFCRQLKGRYHLPVYTIDERLSSVEAKRHESAVRHSGVDAVAAQLILESWLSENADRPL